MACLFLKIALNTIRVIFFKQEQTFTFVNINKTLLLRRFKLLFRNQKKN